MAGQIQDKHLSELMKQAQSGDQRAYETLLRDVYAILRGFIERRLGRCEAWEDVIQDILVSVHKARHTYDQSRPFMPWMFSIARCRIADYWRRTFRKLEDRFSDQEEAEEPADVAPSGENLMADKLALALDRLTEKQRRVVNLLKVDGLSIREAAKAMNMTESAIKVTAHRAYRALRQNFEKDTDGYESTHTAPGS